MTQRDPLTDPAALAPSPPASGEREAGQQGARFRIPRLGVEVCIPPLVLSSIAGYLKYLPHGDSQDNPVTAMIGALLDDSMSLTLVVLGTILLSAALFLAKLALAPGSKAAPVWLKTCLVACFLTSIAAFTAAPSVRLLRFRSLRPATRATVLTNLRANALVHYVIRLIPYDQTSKDYLGIGKLTNLGRCCDDAATDAANEACRKAPDPQRCTVQRYVFVADYAELRGLPVREAVTRVGGSMDGVSGVSAIIFPLDGKSLYPANARGLLQAVNAIDHSHANDPTYTSFELDRKLNVNLELSDVSIPSYSWQRVAETYSRHCRLAEEFRCAGQYGHPYSAALRLGRLSRDWHPLGFARQTEEDACAPRVDHCAVAKWDDVDQQVKKNEVARAFLIDNYPIINLRGRYMVDYDNPSMQTIIDIGEIAQKR